MSKGRIALLFTAFVWGMSFSFVDLALDAGWTTFLILAVRGLLAGVFLTMFSYKKKFWRNKRLMRDGIFTGFLLSMGMILQTYGQLYSTVANASFITVLYIVFVPLLMWRKHRLSLSVFIAIVLAISGTALLSLNADFRLNSGDILLVGCAFFFAVHIIFNEKLTHHNDLISATTIQVYTMGVVALVFALFEGITMPSTGYIYVAFVGIMANGIAVFTMMYGQAHTHPTIAGLLMSLESLFGALFAILILGDLLTLKVAAGGTLMLASVFMIEVGPKFLKVIRKRIIKFNES